MRAEKLEKLQCPLCIKIRCGRNSLLRHLITVHKQTLKQLTELENKYYLGKVKN